MEKTFNIQGHKVTLRYQEDRKTWLTQAVIAGDTININIILHPDHHREETINWEHFREFYVFLLQSDFPDLVAAAQEMATALGKSFSRSFIAEVGSYEMRFAGFLNYNGEIRNGFNWGTFSYELAFHFMEPDGSDGDSYALYYVKFDGRYIVGAGRDQ